MLIVLGLVSWGSVVAQDAPPGTVLFSDDFSDPANGQLPRQSPNPGEYAVGYSNGAYVIQKVDPDWDRVPTAFVPGAYANAGLAVDAHLTSSLPGQEIVIGCRRDPSTDSEYRFGIWPVEGVFALTRWDNGVPTRLVPHTSSAAINAGDAPNHLEMDCTGPTIIGRVNGTNLATITDATYSQGRFWMGVETASDSHLTVPGTFGGLVVTSLAAPTIPPTARPKPTLVPTSVPAPPPVPTPAPGGATGAALTPAQIYTIVNPSVVQVITDVGMGSGVAIQHGIITDDHVIKGAASIQIATSTGQVMAAQIVKSNAQMDLALLTTSVALPAVGMEPQAFQSVGDRVLELGYPLGINVTPGGGATVSQGLISKLYRDPSDGNLLIMTDAAQNKGESGGALVNMRGSLIGVPEFGLIGDGAQGANFDIAADSVQAFLASP